MPNNSTTWKPGQSGNPRGRPPGRNAIATALKAELEKDEAVGEAGEPLTKAEVIAHRVVDLALDGNLKAAQFIADRTEGKPRQTITTNTQDERTAGELLAEARRRLLLHDRDDEATAGT